MPMGTDGTVNRLGIFGGTFNPIHMGHLIVAQDAIEQFSLSQVIFIPCASAPHKTGRNLAPAAHRLAMIEAAIEGELRFSALDIEIKRGGISYTIDTLRALINLFSGSQLNFLIGTDSLLELHLWKDIYDILQLCEFKTIERPGHRMDSIAAKDLKLKPPWPEKLLSGAMRGHMVEISSSDIRHRVAEGLSIRYLVHPAVEMYIAEHHLYL